MKTLSYSYQEYCDKELGSLIIQILILTVVVLYHIIIFLRPKAFKRKKAIYYEKVRNEPMITVTVLILHYSFAILLAISVLMNCTSGTRFLFHETEDNALVAYGTLDGGEMCNKLYYPIYRSNYGSYTGQFIYVNQDRYYIMCVPGLCVGDKVKITYLPNSKYVIECEILEQSFSKGVSVAVAEKSVLSYLFFSEGLLIFVIFWCKRAREMIEHSTG